MKATLSFNMNDESDRSDYKDAINGKKYSILLEDLLNNHLRQKIKYSSDNYHEEYIKALVEIREHIFTEMKELGIIEDL